MSNGHITFPVEDTLPLAGPIITDHFGWDQGQGDRGVAWCTVCHEAFDTSEQAKNHKCMTDEEAAEICKEHMTKIVSRALDITEETALKLLEGGDSRG